MDKDILLPLELPAVAREKLSVVFAGGLLSSDGGMLRLREVERGLGIAGRLAAGRSDPRDPGQIDHTMVETLKLGMITSAAGERLVLQPRSPTVNRHR